MKVYHKHQSSVIGTASCKCYPNSYEQLHIKKQQQYNIGQPEVSDLLSITDVPTAKKQNALIITTARELTNLPGPAQWAHRSQDVDRLYPSLFPFLV